MPTTPIYGWLTPVLGDENNVPASLATLATQIEGTTSTLDKAEVLGMTMQTSQWDRVGGYGTTIYRQGKTYGISLGLRQLVASPTANDPMFTIDPSIAPPVTIGIVCACSNGSTGLLILDATGTLRMGAGYGAAKPSGTVWIGSAGPWVRV